LDGVGQDLVDIASALDAGEVDRLHELNVVLKEEHTAHPVEVV
jgi:hypothetical protein